MSSDRLKEIADRAKAVDYEPLKPNALWLLVRSDLPWLLAELAAAHKRIADLEAEIERRDDEAESHRYDHHGEDA